MKYLTYLLILTHLNLVAQETWEDDPEWVAERDSIIAEIDHVFANLDKSKLTTGYLYDRGHLPVCKNSNKQDAIKIDSSANNYTSSKVIYLENMLILLPSIKYKKKYKLISNVKINYGLGLGISIPFWIPFSLSIPLEFNHSFGSKHELMVGWMVISTYWFSKNFSEPDFLGFGSTSYDKNNFNLAAFFRFGYQFESDKVFYKMSIGPAFWEIATDSRLWNYSALYYNEIDFSLLLLPAIGIGKVF